MTMHSASSAQFLPIRYAVKLNPPSFFLEYTDASGRHRVREVKVSLIQRHYDISKLSKKVIRSFPRQLDRSCINEAQVCTLVEQLVSSVTQPSHQQGESLTRSTSIIQCDPPPGAIDRVQSKAAFSQSSSSHSSEQHHQDNSRQASGHSTTDPDPHAHDLNKVTDEELARRKAEMDQIFQAALIKPGHPSYVYDKQVDFNPVEPNEWDDEEEEEDEEEGQENKRSSTPDHGTSVDWAEVEQQVKVQGGNEADGRAPSPPLASSPPASDISSSLSHSGAGSVEWP